MKTTSFNLGTTGSGFTESVGIEKVAASYFVTENILSLS